MSAKLDHLKELAFQKAPDLHPSWVRAEDVLRQESKFQPPPLTPLARQPIYAQFCRDLLESSTALGTQDEDLAAGFSRTEFTVPSTLDSFPIPILQLDPYQEQGGWGPGGRAEHDEKEPEVIIIYYHGGGLHVGEADSEEFSCRRIVKSCSARVRLYSVGYRLMPKYKPSTCVSDALDAFMALRSTHLKTIIVGSSSGGQLAATVAQKAPKGAAYGLLLRCPATCDTSVGEGGVPEWLRPFHTSRDPSFATFIFDKSKAAPVPHDDSYDLPLEASPEAIAGYPKTWIQLCTNDNLYSDGLCLAMMLVAAGVEVRYSVWEGWPHTFWLRTPHLAESSNADKAMLEGLEWLLE